MSFIPLYEGLAPRASISDACCLYTCSTTTIIKRAKKKKGKAVKHKLRGSVVRWCSVELFSYFLLRLLIAPRFVSLCVCVCVCVCMFVLDCTFVAVCSKRAMALSTIELLHIFWRSGALSPNTCLSLTFSVTLLLARVISSAHSIIIAKKKKNRVKKPALQFKSVFVCLFVCFAPPLPSFWKVLAARGLSRALLLLCLLACLYIYIYMYICMYIWGFPVFFFPCICVCVFVCNTLCITCVALKPFILSSFFFFDFFFFFSAIEAGR